MKLRPGLAAAALAALCACPAPERMPAATSPDPRPAPRPARRELEEEGTDVAGVVHVVRRGQTLYRIARVYGVEPDELMKANGISDPRTLEVGQELFVPGARRVLDVPDTPGPLPPPPRDDPPPRPDPSPRPMRPEVARLEPAPSPPPGAVHAARLSWPLKGVLYGRFGPRGRTHHDGIDIAAPEGSSIAAAADGTVVFVGKQSGYGNVVILRHDDGLVTLYAHASATLVREGMRVTRGQPVARVGQTGRTTGPHLHFEVREGVKPKNPLLYLP